MPLVLGSTAIVAPDYQHLEVIMFFCNLCVGNASILVTIRHVVSTRLTNWSPGYSNTYCIITSGIMASSFGL